MEGSSEPEGTAEKPAAAAPPENAAAPSNAPEALAANEPVVSVKPPEALQPNQLFGRYRVVRDLGAGGMAQVFLAAIEGPGGFQKQCVVKKILPEFAKNPNFAQMFIHEARVAAMMSHQNIVQVFEFAQENDNYFLAMEYVSGAALGRLMRVARKMGTQLGPQIAVEIGIGIAHALAYAHSLLGADGQPLSIVHRDVSPENILVSRDGAVKLTDFGVVKSAINSEATVAGVVKGKWAYMSPEQVANQRVDGRSDIFTLGIVLYEVSVGRRLFRGDSVAATVAALTQGTITPPSTLVPDFPPQLEKIIMTALNRAPDQRYQSGAEFAAALEAFRATQAWTPGQRRLSELVNALFPRDGSAPKSTITTQLSMQGGAFAPGTEDEDLPLVSDGIKVDAPAKEASSTMILVVGLAAILGSALLWLIILLLDRPPT